MRVVRSNQAAEKTQMETATQQELEAGCLAYQVCGCCTGSWPKADDLEKELERVMEEAR